MKNTEQEIRQAIKLHKELRIAVKEYFWKRYEADTGWEEALPYQAILDDIEIGEIDEMVQVRCHSRGCGRGCCGDESFTYKFPISYLWMDQTEALADMAKRAANDKLRQAEMKKQETLKSKERQEKAERAQLEKLQEKYGKDPVD